MSAFAYSNYLPLCQKSEKTGAMPEKITELMDGQTNGHTDRQLDRQQSFYRTLDRTGVLKILCNNHNIEIFKPLDY